MGAKELCKPLRRFQPYLVQIKVQMIYNNYNTNKLPLNIKIMSLVA